MKRRLIAILMAGIMILATGCSANVSVDPDTGVLSIDGTPVNELMKNIDPDTLKGLSGSENGIEENDTDEENGNEKDDNVTEYRGGLRIAYPDEFKNAAGVVDAFSGDLERGVYITELQYCGVPEEWIKEAIDIDDPDPEDVQKYKDTQTVLTYVVSIDGDRDKETLEEILRDNLPDEEKDGFSGKDLKELCKVDDCTFYRVTTFDGRRVENLDEDFAEEYDKLYGMLDDVLENAEYFKPVHPYADMLGKKIEFTTTDVDGNEITSEEIFSKNKVTMINVWATWCHWCVEELPDLNKMNEELAKKDCAIIGLLGDGTDEEAVEEGKRILKEKGVTYLNILPWEGAVEDVFKMESWPSSFFVDSEGTIIELPVIGASMDAYEETFDLILNGDESESKTETVTEAEPGETPSITANDVKQYRVYVTDTEGDPVKGAMVQMCDDSTCRVGNTDEDGLAVFEVKEEKYTVHVLKVPKGYKKVTEEYEMPDEYSDLHIVIEKE